MGSTFFRSVARRVIPVRECAGILRTIELTAENTMEHKIRYGLARARLTLSLMALGVALLKFNPNQPRVPAGRPEGGQWTRIQVAGKWNERNRAQCELQYETDMFQCRFVLSWRSCQSQAMVRLVSCMKGDPIPSFNY